MSALGFRRTGKTDDLTFRTRIRTPDHPPSVFKKIVILCLLYKLPHTDVANEEGQESSGGPSQKLEPQDQQQHLDHSEGCRKIPH